MKHLVFGVVFLAAAITACTDAPLPTGEGRLVPTSASPATDPLSKANRLPASLERKVQLTRADLESRGYEVARGYMTLWGAEDCKAPMQTVGFCYGNNPTAPYVLAVVPQWNDEHVDQALHHALLKAQRNMSAIHRLDEGEALVILAEMPPPARYFGVMTNVFTREAEPNPNDPIFENPLIPDEMRSILFAASPVPSRLMLIASIGDATNNVTMEAQSGSPPWNQQRFFVVTADQGVAGDVTAALVSAGVATEHVFTERVAPSLMTLGLGPEADDFITYMRYALPDNPVAGDRMAEGVAAHRAARQGQELVPHPGAVRAGGLRGAHVQHRRDRRDERPPCRVGCVGRRGEGGVAAAERDDDPVLQPHP